MTVCIAALCGFNDQEGPYVIAAADRMITIGDLEYEPDQTKIVNFASETIGLFAGDMQLHASVVPKTRVRINDVVKDTGVIDTETIANIYAEEFAFYRRKMAEREILTPRGLDFDRYLTRQTTMAHYQVSDIDAQLLTYSVPATAIIAGIDGRAAHVYKVENPGVAHCYDTPCFAATGSGEDLATTQFMFSGFDKTWSFPNTLWLTFLAKAKAEAAGGVGSKTDIVIISGSLPAGRRIYRVEDEHKKVLYQLFRESSERENQSEKLTVGKIEEYLKSLPTAETNNETRSTDSQTQSSQSEQSNPSKGKIAKKAKTARRSRR